MSGFIGNDTDALSNILRPGDYRIHPGFVVDLDPFTVVMLDEAWLEFQFCTQWWPRGGSLIMGGDGNDWCEATWMDRSEMVEPKGGGTNSRLGIQGITCDKYGTPVGGVTCKLFRTVGDLYKDVLIDETISDPQGNYLLSTPFFPDTHYAVFYKVGSPDIFGTTPNILTGA